MSRQKELLFIGTIIAALVMLCPAARASKSPYDFPTEGWTGLPSRAHPFWWAQINFTKPRGVPWGEAVFTTLARSGMNGVEINMNWGDIEPQRNRYNFRLIDRYMAEAAKAHLKIYLLFWESVAGEEQGKNPPRWITARDVASDGVPALEPPWWDESSRKAYFDYIARTIDHVKNSPGFGGVYAAYGWLDSEWGPAPKGSHGVTGYAPTDIKAFYRWLPETYKTLANFNRQWHTSYHAWSGVPVGRPGEPMFALYQRFRQYSAEEGFEAVTRLVREHTNGTVLFSWGGGIDGKIGPTVQGNDPDMFFRLAKKYHVIINLDDSNAAGLALVFGGLVRTYRSAMINEWTPWRTTDLHAEIPQFLGHMGLNSPFAVGADFFIYPPPPNHPGFVAGWKAYQEWREILASVIQGTSPVQPVAVIVPLRKISLSTNLNPYPNLMEEIGDFWQHHHVLPYFISDEQVARGMVNLRQFHAIVDLGDEVATLPALKKYAENHPVLKNLDQLLSYVQPYATLNPTYNWLEVTPTVKGSSVWLMLGNFNGGQAYSGTVRFDPAALGLHSAKSFSLKDAKTGQAVPATRSANGDIQWRVNLPASGFQVLHLDLSRAEVR